MALRRAVELKPDHPDAWRLLGDHLTAIGDSEGADAAYLRHVKASTRNPELLRAAGAMVRKDLPRAEALLKAHLRKAPTDVPAIRMLAEVAARHGRDDDAEKLLERCLELAPSFTPALYNYAVLLNRRKESDRALPAIERLLAAEPRHPGYRNFHAVLLSRLGDYERAAQIYAELLREYPSHAKVWLSYGHTLKTGQRQEGVAAYRRSIALEPAFGEAYWSLANLKTFRFAPDEVAAMEAQVGGPAPSATRTAALALRARQGLRGRRRVRGVVLRTTTKANRAAARARPLRRGGTTERTAAPRATLFTREFFAARAGGGLSGARPDLHRRPAARGFDADRADPCQPFAGRGHDGVAGTWRMARDAAASRESQAVDAYPETAGHAGRRERRDWASSISRGTRIQRKTDRPFFIDKMPNNFAAHRHDPSDPAEREDHRRPPASAWLLLFQLQAALCARPALCLQPDRPRPLLPRLRGPDGAFRRSAAGPDPPGVYERMVEDTEAEVRRLLDYCGLPFEAACLRFFENERAVRTPSSEQVRQPIYRDGRRPVAALRRLAGSPESRARAGPRHLPGRPDPLSPGVASARRLLPFLRYRHFGLNLARDRTSNSNQGEWQCRLSFRSILVVHSPVPPSPPPCCWRSQARQSWRRAPPR